MSTAAVPQKTAPQSSYPSSGITNPSQGLVLLVEDEADLRTLLSYHLRKENYTVLSAENGRIACELIDANKPDLVLLDILMPELDGWEVCKKIREHEDSLISSTPIIMLTALRDERDKFKGLQLGADAFINKPYSLKEVLLHCHNFVRSRQKHLALLENKMNVRYSPKKSIYQLLKHELKNHLTIIGGMANIINRSEGVAQKEKEFAASIRKSSQYLEMIVTDIHLFEEIEDKSLDIPNDYFDLNEMVDDIVEMLRSLAEEKRITLHVSVSNEPNRVHLNKTALKIILATIFENALKYCHSGSLIEIAAACENNKVSVSIADSGPGIGKDEQKNIFVKHYRAPGESQQKPGSGLGLYFAKILTEAMNGSITVESSPGKGSTFTITFQLNNGRPDGLSTVCTS